MERVVEMGQAWRYGQLTADVKNATLTGIRKAVDFWIKGDFKSPNWCAIVGLLLAFTKK
jgi:hypothetical protein